MHYTTFCGIIFCYLTKKRIFPFKYNDYQGYITHKLSVVIYSDIWYIKVVKWTEKRGFLSMIPTKKQLEFMDWEVGAFFHFGIRTFYEGHRDFDNKIMPPEAFNPTELNCDQWMEVIKKGGAKYAILTCKHHDGFANWPSAYTEYSVKNAKWKNGNGDVVREFTDACRRHGIKVGLYYSPAQVGAQMENEAAYDEYFINQITELLTNYGKIEYLWFDGCGSENHQYDVHRIVTHIRKLQPEIMLFEMWDPDTRWIGNEEGVAPYGSKNVVNRLNFSVKATEAVKLDEAKFLPFECDCRIRQENWFYSDNDTHLLRTPENIEALYDYSVGRGGNLLINIAPDRRGLLPEEDSAVFGEFGKLIEKKFKNPLECRAEYQDGKIIFTPQKLEMVNCVVIGEDLTCGENCEGVEVSLLCYGSNKISLAKYPVIGHKQIIYFPETYIDNKCRQLMIEYKGDDTKIKDVKLYYTK